MREGAGAGRGEAQHLKSVRQRTAMTPIAAIFNVVMDRVVIGRDRLERGEIGLGDGSARNIEALANREILEKPALWETVLPPVETLAIRHRCNPCALRCRIKGAGTGDVNSQHGSAAGHR